MQKHAENAKMSLSEVYMQIDPAKRAILDGIYTNVVWMENKLYETIQDAQNEPLTVLYDNGGGQAGIRKNPVFEAYEALYKTYQSGVRTILEALPDDIDVEVEKPATVLQLVREKHA